LHAPVMSNASFSERPDSTLEQKEKDIEEISRTSS